MRFRKSLFFICVCFLFLSFGWEVGQGLYAIPYHIPQDSVRFPIHKTIPKNYQDLEGKYPMDLEFPSSIKSEFIYDSKTGNYLYVTLMNGRRIGTPIIYTPEQYWSYIRKKKQNFYFSQKDKEEAQREGKKVFNPFDFGFELGPAEKVFGKGGVRLRTQGSAEVLLGVKSNATENPSLPENARKHTFFDFDQKIQANMQASVGSKLNFNLNYNTETTFDFDTKKLKLAYEGEEDDIIKVVEAGNVSLRSKNSLIQGGGSLFGIHTALQFGKLDLDLVISQQEAETKRISSEGGAQTTPFEFSANNYDENRHFFLGHYFREHYDKAMSTLPFVSSGIVINRIEVWITNKRANFEEARNIVAFADLGEGRRITAPNISTQGSADALPDNNVNTLYQKLLGKASLRRIDRVSTELSEFEGGRDYEKIESARRLGPNEFFFNPNVGYISLNMRLSADEVLAVAFEYTYQGKVYQVGEFSTDRSDTPSDNLYVKLLKGSTMSPKAPCWDFMMRNVYALGMNVMDLKAERFRLDILYRDDKLGAALPYINEGGIKGKLLLQVLGMDRLDKQLEAYPDGVFDFVPNYTVLPQRGLLFFSTIEPFGATLRKKIGDNTIADKYVYQELYDLPLVEAKQIAEKDKFILRGEYQASSSGEISLGAGIANVTPGSVRVTAGGVKLTENVDYTVNYAMGTVTIINESILNSGTRVDVSLENRGLLNLQRKTMFGADLNYHFSKDFVLGATFMHLSEMPLTTKTPLGSESMQNTLWGLNLSYQTKWQGLTNVLSFIPFLDLTAPSEITVNAEFAHLIPGHYEGRYAKGYSYIDDFETSQNSIDLMNPYSWMLSSTPSSFVESKLSNDIRYGEHRALLSWFYIDPMFNSSNSSLTPSYIRNDLELQSNHFSREIKMQELFPYRDFSQSQLSYLQTFNISYYPQERGPYNLNSEAFLSNGLLSQPEKNWGGMMRKIDQSNFEAANVEYLEFWLLDPFVNNKNKGENNKGGDLIINLGEVNEEVLRDERKFFENGMPINDDPKATIENAWGKVPIRQGTGYAFDNAPGARAKQDVGFNGLNDAQEKLFAVYSEYLQKVKSKVSPMVWQRWSTQANSLVNDPAGDDFIHYRNELYTRNQSSILERYKYYNGVEGNSAEAKDQKEIYSIASRIVPDAEDISQDNTLNENEKYFEYKISLRSEQLAIGKNFIVDARTSRVRLANGKQESVTWYQFKIPIRKYTQRIGGIADFKNIRFMRLYLTNFESPIHLRFGTFKLVRGDWRQYNRELHKTNVQPISEGQLEVSTVNIEENGDRQPVNYVLPPGVLRSLDPSSSQVAQQNEQALSLKVKRLAPGDARAIYRNTGLDLRRYKKLELFSHAEKILEESNATMNGDFSLFIRLGSDYSNNYYEYAVPLSLTPYGIYSTESFQDRKIVWPEENLCKIIFESFTNLKTKRNREHGLGNSNADFFKIYSSPDPQAPRNTISVIGNPSLSNVKTIMIGVRNNSTEVKSIEVWVNELRLSDYAEQGGWAANTDMHLKLSDWGNIAFQGQIQSAGFGALDQSLSQRKMEDLRQINLSANFEMGRFFPEKAKVSIPFYYAFTDELITPQYNPLDGDIRLSEAIKAMATKEARDSIRQQAVTQTRSHAISLSNIRVDYKSKTPMPYDPANFSASYSYNQTDHTTPEYKYDRRRDWQASLSYDYSPVVLPLKPFKWIKSHNSAVQVLKSYQINYLPSKIAFSTSMFRHYSEQQVRNYIPNVAQAPSLPATFIQNFVWNRDAGLNWNLSSNLQFSFRSGTDARIEEPHVQVNKKLEPDKYKLWRDSVNQSILHMGTPMQYQQTANLTWRLPFSYIPYMNWITGSIAYTGSYNWDLGAKLPDGKSIGNVIKNEMRIESSAGMNIAQLYRLIPFFREIEEKVSKGNTSSLMGRKRKFRRERTQIKPKKFEKTVQLTKDGVTELVHNLNTKKIEVRASRMNGTRYSLRTHIVDKNKIEIRTKDSLQIRVQILAKEERKEEKAKERSMVWNHLIYSLMMLKDINVSYSRTNNLNLPGFMPVIGAAGGQAYDGGILSPGLAFAFGFEDNSYVKKAYQRGWLTTNKENINPSVFSQTENLAIRVTLEPIKDFRISLMANRMHTKGEETNYVFQGLSPSYRGSFTMTTIGLKGFFFTPLGKDGYASSSFEEFLGNREKVADRYYKLYAEKMGAKKYHIKQNSADILIPSFLAAYTQRNVSSMDLSPFPSLLSLLPNWNITYTGLSKLPFLQSIFRNVSLSHNYMATYSVGSYASLLGWTAIGEKGDMPLGILQTKQGQDFSKTQQATIPAENVASLPFDIPSVTIQEGFNPLIGLELTLKSGVSISSRWNKRRTMNLNITSYQLVESSTDEITAGISYKVDNFSELIGLKKKRKKSSKERNSFFTSGGAMTLRLDYSYNRSSMLIRKIQENFTQATNGNIAHMLRFSADYALSRMLTLRAYYDWNMNHPLVSTASFPTRNSNFGVSLRINLTQ